MVDLTIDTGSDCKPAEDVLEGFLREYFRGTTGVKWIGAFRNSDSKLQPRHLGPVIGRGIAPIREFNRQYDQPENQCGIYFLTATLKEGASQRTSENCSEFTSIFADV